MRKRRIPAAKKKRGTPEPPWTSLVRVLHPPLLILIVAALIIAGLGSYTRIGPGQAADAGHQGAEGPLQAPEAPSTPGPASLQETAAPPDPADLSGTPINITTSDNVRLFATIYNKKASKGILLLHMLGRDQATYAPLIPDLAKHYTVLAIDLRGHGKSQGNHRTFSQSDFQAMAKDVDAAIAAMGKQEVAIIGASIGANLALQRAASDPSVKTVILLSPGMDYRGVSIATAAAKLNKPALAIASKGDSYAASSINELSAANKAILANTIDGNVHGTDMLEHATAVKVSILKWVQTHLSP